MKGDEYKFNCDGYNSIDWELVNRTQLCSAVSDDYHFHKFQFPKLKRHDAPMNNKINERTHVEIIPAKELAKVNDFSLQKAMIRFNEIVSGSAAQQYRFVFITEYPFINLCLDGIFLSRCEYQLKRKILDAGYRIQNGFQMSRSVLISWPLPF
ncbi:hypothetical protein [Klebsiella oxytoca]|uniref:hypothetical protein n=1 Tax=Klebsiella oxytoca TaxID=571 RepID=UPI003A8EAAE2